MQTEVIFPRTYQNLNNLCVLFIWNEEASDQVSGPLLLFSLYALNQTFWKERILSRIRATFIFCFIYGFFFYSIHAKDILSCSLLFTIWLKNFQTSPCLFLIDKIWTDSFSRRMASIWIGNVIQIQKQRS